MNRSTVIKRALAVGAVLLSFAAGTFFWWNWWTAYPEGGAKFNATSDVEVLSYHLASSDSVMLTLPSGTTIDIPAQAFALPNGEIPDSVTFLVREYHTAADILKGGIQMQMEPGSQSHLQSAGMFHFEATSQGRELTLREASSLGVSIPADTTLSDDFKLWRMDAGRWTEIGAVTSAPNDARINALNQIDSTLQANAEEPSIDNFRIPEAFQFQLYGDPEDAPYLKPYMDLVWEWIPDEKGQSPPLATFRNAWTECAVEKQNGDEYVLTFTYEKTGVDGGLAFHEERIKARPLDKKKNLKQREEAYAAARETWEADMAALREQRMFLEAQSAFAIQFRVGELGLINVDKLESTEDWEVASLSFDFAPAVGALDKSLIFLILEDQRSVISFNRSDWDEVPVPPTGRCHVYSVLGHDQVAYVSPEEFDRQIRSKTQPRPFRVDLTVNTETMTMTEGIERLTSPANNDLAMR